jgi:hypothetical protein
VMPISATIIVFVLMLRKKKEPLWIWDHSVPFVETVTRFFDELLKRFCTGTESRGHDILPTRSKNFIICSSQSDFYYENMKLCVFVDGPPHESERVSKLDQMTEWKKLMQKNGWKKIKKE